MNIEGGWECDCDQAFKRSAYAGAECEHPATEYCGEEGDADGDVESLVENSRHSFCTNGGGCRMSVGTDEDHQGCDCPPDFEGPHCEYLMGTMPTKRSNTSKASAAVMYAVLIVAFVTTLVALGCTLYKWKKAADLDRELLEANDATADLGMSESRDNSIHTMPADREEDNLVASGGRIDFRDAEML